MTFSFVYLECTIIINLPNKQLIAKETRDGVLAAIDSAESKVTSQIRRYKAELIKSRESEGILSKAKRILRRKWQNIELEVRIGIILIPTSNSGF